jgi:hypothetical protein
MDRDQPAGWQGRTIDCPNAGLWHAPGLLGLERSTAVWPSSGDIYYHENRGAEFEFDEMIEKLASKKDYFLVTDFEELDRQPVLKEWLQSEACMAFSGDGYTIYDLKSGCVN